MLVLDCPHVSVLGRRILSLTPRQRTTLRRAFLRGNSCSETELLDLLMNALTFGVLPSCIGLDNIHLLDTSGGDGFLLAFRAIFAKGVGPASQKISVFFSGIPSRDLEICLDGSLIVDDRTEYNGTCACPLYIIPGKCSTSDV
jgi:hypothetical protein